MQPALQVHGEQVQFGLSQPPPEVPQSQPAPQEHWVQVQFGLSQACLVVSVMAELSHDGGAGFRCQPVRSSRRAATIRSSRARATRERMVPSGHPHTSAASS